MNKKIAAKFISCIMAFLCCVGGHVFAYNPLAVTRAIIATNQDERVRYIFTNYIPTVRISMLLGMPTGIHTVYNYCWLLNCSENELKDLLEGSYSAENNTVSNEMINDFMCLADEVKAKIEQQ